VSENGIVVTLAGDGGDELFTGYRRHLAFSKMHPDELRKMSSPTRFERDSMRWFPSECLSNDPINNILYQECLGRVADDFLIRNDRLGMNFSMEARFPLTNRKFREYALSIPSKYKIQNSVTKVIPKVAYKGLLPDYVINKQKTGWSIPKFFLLNNNFRDWAMDILSPNYYPPTESLLDSSKILDLFAASSRDYRASQKCLGSIAFKIWAKLFKVSI
jgi:asparagine synthase (glutamine-hydrolysing)